MASIEELCAYKDGRHFDIDFDEAETYKAIGVCSSNFNNVIDMITIDLLAPYVFN